MREPKENLEGYLVAVQKLNECVGYIKQNSKAAIQLLEEAADTVMQPENIGTDNVRVRRITDALAALKSHRAGEITILKLLPILCQFHVKSRCRGLSGTRSQNPGRPAIASCT